MSFAIWVAVWIVLAGIAGYLLSFTRVLERLSRPVEPEWIWRTASTAFALLLILTLGAAAAGGRELVLKAAGADDRPEWTLWLIFSLPLHIPIGAAAFSVMLAMRIIQQQRTETSRRTLSNCIRFARFVACCILVLAFIALAFISVPGAIIFGSGLLMSLGARARSQRVTLLWMLSAATQTHRPLHTELRAWAEVSRGRHRRRLEHAADLLEQGRPLSDALDLSRLLPAHNFPRLHLAEKIGMVPATLADLAREETERLQPVGESASPFVLAAYLAVVPAASVLIVGFVMYYIIPKFKKIFEDFNTELPHVTRGLITASDGFVNYWYVLAPPIALLTLGAAAAGALSLYFPWHEFRRQFVDPWIVRLAMTDVMRNLAHQLRCQRPVPDALHDVGHYCINWTVRTRLNRVREMVTGGGDLWVELAVAGLITSRELAVLQSARQTGHPDWGLIELAHRRELAWSQPAAWLTTLLRVLVPLALGLFTAWICIALFAPLAKLLIDLS